MKYIKKFNESTYYNENNDHNYPKEIIATKNIYLGDDGWSTSFDSDSDYMEAIHSFTLNSSREENNEIFLEYYYKEGNHLVDRVEFTLSELKQLIESDIIRVLK